MASRRRLRRISTAKVAGFIIWMALVALFLLWQATTYQGIMSFVGEWQFNAVGRHYATFNYVFLVFLLCLPGYLLFLRPGRRPGTERPEASLFRSARAFLRTLIGISAALGASVLFALGLMLRLPSQQGPVRRVDAAQPNAVPPEEGPTILSGQIIYERTAGFDEDLLFAKRSFRFAPVVGSRQGSNEIRYFVQLPPADEHGQVSDTPMVGVLKRNGLPGEVLRLFRYAGYQVDDPNYVLFIEPSAMRWPYIATIVQFVVGALLALGVALLQRRRVRQIDRRVHAAHTQ